VRWSRFLWVVVIALPVAAMIGASAVGGEDVALVAQPSIGGTTLENHASGLSIRVPDGWHGLAGVPSESGFQLYTGHRYVFDPECTGVDETVNITIEEGDIRHSAPNHGRRTSRRTTARRTRGRQSPKSSATRFGNSSNSPIKAGRSTRSCGQGAMARTRSANRRTPFLTPSP
jgi:hypothetical protein